MVYYVYQSVKKYSFLFDSISSLEIGDYPAIKFSSESVLPKEELTSWISNELPKCKTDIHGSESLVQKSIYIYIYIYIYNARVCTTFTVSFFAYVLCTCLS